MASISCSFIHLKCFLGHVWVPKFEHGWQGSPGTIIFLYIILFDEAKKREP